MKHYSKDEKIKRHKNWVKYQNIKLLELFNTLGHIFTIDESFQKDEILQKIKQIKGKMLLNSKNNYLNFLQENKDFFKL